MTDSELAEIATLRAEMATLKAAARDVLAWQCALTTASIHKFNAACDRLRALLDTDSAPVQCTGDFATWCPVCGNCGCLRWPDGERIRESRDCPLHGEKTLHNPTVAEPESDSPDVANWLRGRAADLRSVLGRDIGANDQAAIEALEAAAADWKDERQQ